MKTEHIKFVVLFCVGILIAYFVDSSSNGTKEEKLATKQVLYVHLVGNGVDDSIAKTIDVLKVKDDYSIITLNFPKYGKCKLKVDYSTGINLDFGEPYDCKNSP